MAYGKIEYDNRGNPICEICGEAHKRVLTHARQIHKITARDYKIRFGLDLNKGICSEISADLSRQKTLSNYNACIAENLLRNGKKSRFKIGDKGRTGDQLSQQAKNKFKERLKEPKMVAAMSKSGKRLGKSGLGNKKRWEGKNDL